MANRDYMHARPRAESPGSFTGLPSQYTISREQGTLSIPMSGAPRQRPSLLRLSRNLAQSAAQSRLGLRGTSISHNAAAIYPGRYSARAPAISWLMYRAPCCVPLRFVAYCPFFLCATLAPLLIAVDRNQALTVACFLWGVQRAWCGDITSTDAERI